MLYKHMELHQALKKLKASPEFKEWDEKSKNNFFSYAFKMIEPNKDYPWSLGFYYETTDKITTFIVNQDSIDSKAEEEAFKKPGTKIKPIDLKKVELTFENILKKAKEFQKQKYSQELVNKTIAILQNPDKYDTIWNLTLITLTFKTINLKINPQNGKIIHHTIESLMDFAEKK